MFLRWLALACLVGVCALGPGCSDPLTAAGPEVFRFPGVASASAAVPVGTNTFVVAGDEDDRLWVYASDHSGPAAGSLALGDFARVQGRSTEMDLEGAAQLGDLSFWLGSHSANKDGKPRPNRQRLLAVRIGLTNDTPRLEPVGRPVQNLLAVLLTDGRYRSLGVDATTVNLEGMAATPDGHLLLGFRAPVPGGQALLALLLNPREAVAGQPVRLGPPVQLDLGGLGIRDLAWNGREYFVLGGDSGSGEGGKPRLYRWAGPGEEAAVVPVKWPKQYNPEALAVFGDPAAPRLLVLSDDGNSKHAKQAPSFRGFWVSP